MSSESPSNKKWAYSFIEGDGKNKKLLGGKGANLCEMTQIGLNVPPGFVITTEACLEYLAAGELAAGIMEQVRDQIRDVEKLTGTYNKKVDVLVEAKEKDIMKV